MVRRLIQLIVFLGVVSCSSQISQLRAGSRAFSPVVLMSDFGTMDDGIAICKGVMLKIEPNLGFVDVTHQIPAFSVRDAARFLANVTPHFPESTVFVVLVERQVNKSSRPIVAKSKRGQYFVLSDNGLLSLLSERQEIEKVRLISENPWVDKANLGSTFLGRDVYAPIAARLARGEDWTLVGPEIEKINLIDQKSFRLSETQLMGEVIALDGPFGNLITDITATAFLNAKYMIGDKVPITIGSKKYVIPFVKTFSDVPLNQKLLYIDSTEHVAIAINEGNFSERYKVKPPMKVVISIKKDK